MREPAFWWHSPGLAATLLSPLAAVYGAVAAHRLGRAGQRIGIPVICVGNFTLGGSGKTPTAIAIAHVLASTGQRPALLSRGYGGSMLGPVIVDPHRHTAAEVGDEALLLAQAAPTIVARDRVAGAEMAHAADATVVIMDDGLQNPSLTKTMTIAVIDGRRGVGNGKVFPAGPLRAPLAAQIARVDAFMVIGEAAGSDPLTAILREPAARRLPLFHGRLAPDRAAIEAIGPRKVLAFAGIGDPEKFFATIAEAGIEAAHVEAFADHHRYSVEEAGDLIMRAEHEGLRLLTTEKDRIRMAGDPALEALHARAHVLPVALQVREEAEWREMLRKAAGR